MYYVTSTLFYVITGVWCYSEPMNLCIFATVNEIMQWIWNVLTELTDRRYTDWNVLTESTQEWLSEWTHCIVVITNHGSSTDWISLKQNKV